MTKSRIIILTLIVMAAIVIAGLISDPVDLKKRLGDEGYKQLWQLSLASIIGGLVSAAFSELKREQDTIEARRQYLRTFHSTALTAHNRAKKIRRMLIAKAVFDSGGVPHVRQLEYDAQMFELQDVQLQLESIKRQARLARARGDVFSRTPNIELQLETMEKFLRKSLREFENFRFPAADSSVPLSTLPDLQELVYDGSSQMFVTSFSAPYDAVEVTLLKLLAT